MKHIIIALIIGSSLVVSAWIIASGLKEAGRSVESAGSHIQSGLNAVSDGLSYPDDPGDNDVINTRSRDVVFHSTSDSNRVHQ